MYRNSGRSHGRRIGPSGEGSGLSAAHFGCYWSPGAKGPCKSRLWSSESVRPWSPRERRSGVPFVGDQGKTSSPLTRDKGDPERSPGRVEAGSQGPLTPGDRPWGSCSVRDISLEHGAYTGAVASLRPWTPPARTVGGVLVGQDPPPRSERAPLDHAPSRGPGRTGGRFTHDSADNALPPGTQLDSEGYGDPGDPTY